MLISIFDKDIEGSAETLGGKGYGLWWMQQQGVNVPPALIIPTSVCVEYMASPKTTLKKVATELKKQKDFFKAIFGYQPLLSVRSGARVSMPGMMDTILNVGLEPKNLSQWEQRLGTDCVMDSYKRLITMYGNVVCGVERKKLECETLPETLAAFQRATEQDFPGADAQLLNSVEAVFKSWNNDRAKYYRKMNNIPEEWGTAVVIQAMVFGNLNDNSGTGVLFTRDPDTGEDVVKGEFLTNAQGEDVVAGIRTPMPLSEMHGWNSEVAKELLESVSKLEKAKTDVQDVEFTIQDGKLFILQTRNAKRSAGAAVKIGWDMYQEGMIDKDTLFKRVSERDLDLSNQPVIDPKFKQKEDFKGLPACSGVQTGYVALSSKEALKLAATGAKVILVTEETTPDDIEGMHVSAGVLTMTGGSTSHAAVVARSMNRTCVVGLGKEHHHMFLPSAKISIDGSTGRVWLCEVPVVGGNNETAGKIRELRTADKSVLVSSAPSFKAAELVIDAGSMLHFDPKGLLDLVDACKAVSDKVSLSFLGGVSHVFLPKNMLDERKDLLVNSLKAKLHKVYDSRKYPGVESVQINTGKLKVTDLLDLKGSTFVGEDSIDFGDAHVSRLMHLLSLDGVTVQVWGGDSAPKAYYDLSA